MTAFRKLLKLLQILLVSQQKGMQKGYLFLVFLLRHKLTTM